MPGACRLRAFARAGRGDGARLQYPITPRPGASRCCPPAERRGPNMHRVTRARGLCLCALADGLGPSRLPLTLKLYIVYARARPAVCARRGAGHEAEALSGRLRIADNRQPSVQDGWPQKMQLRFRILSLSVCVVIGGRASRARRRHPLVGPPRFGLFVPADHRIARSVGPAIEIPHRCPRDREGRRARRRITARHPTPGRQFFLARRAPSRSGCGAQSPASPARGPAPATSHAPGRPAA